MRGAASAKPQAAAAVTYFKRFRMEIDLRGYLFARPALPAGFSLVGWDDSLLDAHAEIKYQSFFGQVDAVVFPSLATREGCRRLMREIRAKPGFRAAATWLITSDQGYCGTVQGIRERGGVGAIQNLGILPEYRGLGLGKALLLKALAGFQSDRLKLGALEVTAQNDTAIRLYRSLGFRRRKSIYKAVDPLMAVVDSEAMGLPEYSFLDRER